MTDMPSYPGNSEPMPSPRQPPQVPAPAEVLTAVKLWFASILVGLLGGILVYALTDKDAALQKALDSNTSGVSRADLQTLVNVGLAIGLIIALVILGLEVFFVLKMKAGRNWARIVLTVLGVLSALSSLVGLAQGFSVGSAVNLISLLLIIAAIVFMFRPAATQYFKQPRA